MKISERQSTLLFAFGLTVALIGYFLPWYAHQSVGLTLIGIDISEWLKFLPQYAQGELPNRDFFYLPPIVLGSAMMVWSGVMGNSWLKRLVGLGLGGLITLLAFPSVDAIRFEPSSEWLLRLQLILAALLLGGLVFAVRLISGERRQTIELILSRFSPALILLLMGLGLTLPFYAAFAFRPVYIEWLQVTPTYGSGLWLFGIGSLCILLSQLAVLNTQK